MAFLGRFLIVLIGFVFGAHAMDVSDANAEGTFPVKIAIEPVQELAQIGQRAEFHVILTDAFGKPAVAPEAVIVTVSSTSPSGDSTETQIIVGAGESSATGSLPVVETGAFLLQGDNPDLLPGGGFLFATNPSPANGDSYIKGDDGNPRVFASHATGADDFFADITAATRGLSDTAHSTKTPEADLAASSTSDAKFSLILRVAEKKILADGETVANVTVSLDPLEPAPFDIVIRLSVTGGFLENDEIIIEKGEYYVKANWRSDPNFVGISQISILGSNPHLSHGNPQFIDFDPPIHEIKLTPNPPEISLFDRGNVQVDLWNTVNGASVKTDEKIKLTLALRQGNGRVQPLDIIFNEGDSTVRADFRPSSWGNAIIEGRIPNRHAQQAIFTISIGIFTIVISVIGGLTGGVFAWLPSRERWWRIAIGAVSGIVLFGALLLFGSEKILGVIGDLSLLNPISVFVFSVFGGWLGTGVIAFIFRQAGLQV